METLADKIARVVREEVAIAPWDPAWPARFRAEAAHLRACLPAELIGRIEHFGSTAVPGLAAKPIIDLLIEVTSLAQTRRVVPPILEAQGYDYFWRPLWDNDEPPYYAWFIKRDQAGRRTHHLHFVEAHFQHWDRLLFRDYLIAHPEAAREYEALKRALAAAHEGDRVAYTRAKSEFITRVTETARAARAAGHLPPPETPEAASAALCAAASGSIVGGRACSPTRGALSHAARLQHLRPARPRPDEGSAAPAPDRL